METPIIYALNLRKGEEFSVGRNLESHIIINELSVSRKHCKLLVNRAKRELCVVDNGAKFGTTVEMSRLEMRGRQEVQKGRTRMAFTKHTKLSLLERLGFCSAGEKLRE